MSTHIDAKKSDIAKIVLMPGDPLRAKWIAENFLKKVKLVNQVRGMYAFTGYYKDKRVTVMGHGMGIPSIGIYSHELFTFFDVKYIIRVGSAGSIDKNIDIGDTFIAAEAFSESHYAEEIGVKVKNKVLKPSKILLDALVKAAKKNKIPYHMGRVNSEDAFYSKYNVAQLKKITGNAQMLEMEAFGLYANAIRSKKEAITILTCSDSLINHKALSPIERQTTFKNMVTIALEAATTLK